MSFGEGTEIGIVEELVDVKVSRDDARLEGLSSCGLLRFSEETSIGGSLSEPLPYPDLILSLDK